MRKPLSEIQRRLKEVRQIRKQMMNNPLEMPPVTLHPISEEGLPDKEKPSLQKGSSRM